MKYTILFVSLFSSLCFAANDREGDLQMPVTDISQIQRQEQELPPSLDEVKMEQKNQPEASPEDKKRSRQKKELQKNQ